MLEVRSAYGYYGERGGVTGETRPKTEKRLEEKTVKELCEMLEGLEEDMERVFDDQEWYQMQLEEAKERENDIWREMKEIKNAIENAEAEEARWQNA